MRQKDEMERTENARARSNRHILWLTYALYRDGRLFWLVYPV